MTEFALSLPDDVVEAIAHRTAEIVIRELRAVSGRSSPYATVREAAEFLSGEPQRIYDLCTQGRLTRIKDGGRTLIAWDELDRYLVGEPTGPTGEQLGRIGQALPRPYRDGYASAIRR